MTYIRLYNVTVRYPIFNARATSIRHQLINISTGGRLRNDVGAVSVTALRDVTMNIDRVGLIGHNGAGKSTLLRTLAGIYEPSEGRIERRGRISTIFEIGAGLDPELSGYENIRRMGLLMGLSLSQMDAAIPEIEELTELGDFLSLPVRTYSAGMTTRLMFAVATAVPPEILLVDEMLGAGDSGFQKRAEERINRLISSASIFVFASHSPELLRRHCNRFFELRHGAVTEVPAESLSALS
jgi:ABC-type polysaccharide/polyol phosphate transport system ATPase subunit